MTPSRSPPSSPSSPGCTLSRVAQQSWRDGAGRLHGAGQSWNDLQAGLLAARADGLEPVVSISGYGSPNATPSWDEPVPDTTTVAGWWEYHCGVQGVLNAVSKLPAADRPHTWEPVNEPDSFSIYKGNEASMPRAPWGRASTARQRDRPRTPPASLRSRPRARRSRSRTCSGTSGGRGQLGLGPLRWRRAVAGPVVCVLRLRRLHRQPERRVGPG